MITRFSSPKATDDVATPHSAADVIRLVEGFLSKHDPATTERFEFLRAQFDAGLAWVDKPTGLGGLDLDAQLQSLVDERFLAAGAPDNAPHKNVIGLGMAAPTLLAYADRSKLERWLRPLWTGEEIWCQLFSEPGAGSDLAAVATRAVRDGDDWIVNGQKVWTSLAHESKWALLVARTDPAATKHAGLTYFVCDMDSPGVDVKALRQITGEAEFNEVFLDDVRVPDDNRLGEIGEGWKVTSRTLLNERVAIGARDIQRETGSIGFLMRRWRESRGDSERVPTDLVIQLWSQAEALRLSSSLVKEKLAAGEPIPEGSAMKIAYAQLAQRAASLELDLCGVDALRFDDWSLRRPDLDQESSRIAGYRYLRSKANSIEGGTSEVLRNVVAERVLGLPAESRTDTKTPWNELPR